MSSQGELTFKKPETVEAIKKAIHRYHFTVRYYQVAKALGSSFSGYTDRLGEELSGAMTEACRAMFNELAESMSPEAVDKLRADVADEMAAAIIGEWQKAVVGKPEVVGGGDADSKDGNNKEGGRSPGADSVTGVV